MKLGKNWTWWQISVHILALIPLAKMIWDFWFDNLTVNPIQELTFRTGWYALFILVLSLACTPANTLFGLRQALALRKPLGLYGFMYVSLHLLVFIGLDYGFSWRWIWEEALEKRFVLVGFASFLLLLPLAITSTKGWQRRLKKNWKRLHRLAYVAVPLGVVHFLWLVKADYREPLAFGVFLAALLLVRVPPIKRQITKWRRGMGSGQKKAMAS